MKIVHTFDGKNAADFIEWYEKIRISLNIYDKAASRVLQGAPVPTVTTNTNDCKLAAWNTANEDLYNVLFFTTKGAACSVVRRFAGKTPAEGVGHGQHAWVALRKIFNVCARAAVRAEHIRMTSTRMHPRQDPDDYLHHMYSFRDRLNSCDPPEGPTDRQNILQVPPSEYDRFRQTHLERRDFDLADIRRMMATIYADNLSRSESSKGIAGSGSAVQEVDRDRTSVLCYYCDQLAHFKRKCPLRIKHHQQ